MSNNIDVFDEEIDIKTILVFINRNKKLRRLGMETSVEEIKHKS